eukprot:TRINITY_DN50271_c0_g1_i1.p1 TRINITY_DN50271_c0_g1~~TRINITY_DN50271_c0_g1_i1.p1  ORF type:complete len:336 (+),score=126.65 TRINITY_DN50271_c0_g1_i1:98-1009(+)
MRLGRTAAAACRRAPRTPAQLPTATPAAARLRHPARRGAAAAAGPLLKYSPDFGSAAAPEGIGHDATAEYEDKYRLKGGDLCIASVVAGGKAVASAGSVAPGVYVAPAEGAVDSAQLREGVPLKQLEAIQSQRIERLPDSPVLLADPAHKADGDHPNSLPSCRFKEGALVLACGHDADGMLLVAPGRVLREVEEDRKLLLDCAQLPLGGVVLDMTNRRRLFGVMTPSGEVISAKDPYFVVNWAAHCIPLVVPEGPGRIDPLIMQYVNDIKRTLVRNKDIIPSMKLCQKVFIRNSVEDFQHYML